VDMKAFNPLTLPSSSYTGVNQYPKDHPILTKNSLRVKKPPLNTI